MIKTVSFWEERFCTPSDLKLMGSRPQTHVSSLARKIAIVLCCTRNAPKVVTNLSRLPLVTWEKGAMLTLQRGSPSDNGGLCSR
jgi:hypothetical protein